MHRISDYGLHQRFTVPRMEPGDDSRGSNHRSARPAGAGRLRVARRANRFDYFRRCFAPKLARPQKSRSRKLQLAQALQGDLGCCPVPPAKIFCFAATPNHQHLSRHPASQEGRFAVVTNVGCRMRWTRQRRKTSGADPPSPKLRRTGTKTVEQAFAEGERGRRSRVVLTPRRWRQVPEKQASQG
jgi:hypothetical protein